jgi:hypothetical protein
VKSPLGSLLNQFLVRMDPHTQKPSGAELERRSLRDRVGTVDRRMSLYTSVQCSVGDP